MPCGVCPTIPRSFSGRHIHQPRHHRPKFQDGRQPQVQSAGAQSIHGQPHTDPFAERRRTFRTEQIVHPCRSCRIQNVGRHPRVMLCGAGLKTTQLFLGGCVEAWIVRSGEVGHDRDQIQRTVLQKVGRGFIFVGGQPQSVHARVELEVHWPAFHVVFFGPSLAQLQVGQGHHLGLQLMCMKGVEGSWVGVEHQDPRPDARFPQPDPFLCIRHGQPVHPLAFEQPAHLHRVGSIAQALDDCHHPSCSGVCFQATKVVDQSRGIQGKGGHVSCGGEGLHNRPLPLVGRDLPQNVSAPQTGGRLQKVVGVVIEGNLFAGTDGVECLLKVFFPFAGPLGHPHPDLGATRTPHHFSQTFEALMWGQP